VNHRHPDLVVVATIALVALLVPAITGAPTLQALALPLVLALPGYALTAALFPRRAVGGAELLLLSLAFSLAIAALGGFVLHLTPWGLRAGSWLALLVGITLGGTLLALLRRRHNAESTAWRAPAWPQWHKALTLALTALVLVGALSMARDGALRQQQGERFTQLWMLPAENTGARTLRIGIRNMEQQGMRYRLQLVAAGEVLHEWNPVTLAAGEQWATTAELATPPAGQVLEARLYRIDGGESAYRRVVLRGNGYSEE
jgi:uncharacterized membrane protein